MYKLSDIATESKLWRTIKTDKLLDYFVLNYWNVLAIECQVLIN